MIISDGKIKIAFDADMNLTQRFMLKYHMDKCAYMEEYNDFLLCFDKTIDILTLNLIAKEFNVTYTNLYCEYIRQNHFMPHELKNYLCYIEDKTITVLMNWDGRFLGTEWDIMEGFDNDKFKDFKYRNLICLSAYHLMQLGTDYKIECNEWLYKELIRYGEDRTPI